MAAEGTPCAGADLIVEKAPVRLLCPDCGNRFDANDWNWACPKCEQEATCVDSGGDELELCSLEASVPEDELKDEFEELNECERITAPG